MAAIRLSNQTETAMSDYVVGRCESSERLSIEDQKAWDEIARSNSAVLDEALKSRKLDSLSPAGKSSR